MKKLVATIAAAVTGLIAFPDKAEAGVHVSFTYQSGRSSCGCPIYTKRYVAGYDCHHRPVYRYVHVPVTHRCGPPVIVHPHHRGNIYYKHSRKHCKPVYPHGKARGHGHYKGHGRPGSRIGCR